MKKVKTRILALLLSVIVAISTLPISVYAASDNDDFTVVVSLEGLTLGQGLYFEPTAYTLDEINELIATEGYGPYTEDDLTAAMATLAMFIDKGVEYENTGDWADSFYLSSVKDVDTGSLNIPEIIGENGGPTNDDNTGNSDEYLGEFDYSYMSGWMITVNNNLIPVGAASYGFKDYRDQGTGENYGDLYVVRWQFSGYGYGADLGFDSGWGSKPYFTAANKDALYSAYAMSNNAANKAAALPVMENLTATQSEVDAATATLTETTATRTPQDISSVLNATMAKLAQTVTEPVFGTLGGEWTVLSLARGDYYETGNDYFEGYYDRVVDSVNETAASVTLQNGALHKTKSTDNSRLILALSAIGKDATSVGNWNLITPYEDFSWIKKQGLNGPVFALIALDTVGYQTADTTIRQQCIDFILSKQLADGGWAFSGTTADPDMTGMALQALAPYKDQEAVANAADAAFNVLSNMQQDDGGYASWGSVNSESISQVIVACTAWGINPDTDARFVKNDKSAVDALLNFYNEEEARFHHVLDGATDAMATDQACYALISYKRFVDGKNSLYDMTDVEIPENKGMAATISLPENIENSAGTTFNAIVNLSNWDSEAGYKLMDCILNIPDSLTVTGVTMGSRVGGGQVSYNFKESTGELRIVYFDPQTGNDITVSGKDNPCEYMTIGLEVKEKIDVSVIDTLMISISGMSFKKNSDSTADDSMTVVDTSKASDSVSVVRSISYSVMTLYTGDGVDIIPTNKTAVAIAVTGISEQAKITFTNGNVSYSPKYNAAISEKTGVSTYVCMISSDDTLEDFVDKSNYTVSTDAAENMTFGDSNNDGIVNAQDALASVNKWLRKGDEPTDDEVLTLNVNADARLNTYDVLGIVEHFVNGDEFAVVTKAASLKEIIE